MQPYVILAAPNPRSVAAHSSRARGSSSSRLLTLRSLGVIQYLPGADKKVA